MQTAKQSVLQVPSEETTLEEETGVPLRIKCYCNALMSRARFIQAGYKRLPCDGTLCRSIRESKKNKEYP